MTRRRPDRDTSPPRPCCPPGCYRARFSAFSPRPMSVRSPPNARPRRCDHPSRQIAAFRPGLASGLRSNDDRFEVFVRHYRGAVLPTVESLPQLAPVPLEIAQAGLVEHGERGLERAEPTAEPAELFVYRRRSDIDGIHR